MLFIQKFLKFEFCVQMVMSTSKYQLVSPHTLLDSVWQVLSSWVVGFIVGERIAIVVFPWVCSFMMADLREQHVCIKLCFKLGKNTAEMHQMLTRTFGDNSLGQMQTCYWYKLSKMTKHWLMMRIIRDGGQLASCQKMSWKLGIWLCKIIDLSSKTSVTHRE
jgi:hypothetical protein